jgi:hypothetical protein
MVKPGEVGAQKNPQPHGPSTSVGDTLPRTLFNGARFGVTANTCFPTALA